MEIGYETLWKDYSTPLTGPQSRSSLYKVSPLRNSSYGSLVLGKALLTKYRIEANSPREDTLLRKGPLSS